LQKELDICGAKGKIVLTSKQKLNMLAISICFSIIEIAMLYMVGNTLVMIMNILSFCSFSTMASVAGVIISIFGLGLIWVLLYSMVVTFRLAKKHLKEEREKNG